MPLYCHPRLRVKACKLLKGIYGLKQAGRVWNETFTEVLLELGYLQSQADPCVFVKSDMTKVNIVFFWVDDIILACENAKTEKWFEVCIRDKFGVKDLGEVSWFLGIRVSRNTSDGTIQLDQQQYLERVLVKLG